MGSNRLNQRSSNKTSHTKRPDVTTSNFVSRYLTSTYFLTSTTGISMSLREMNIFSEEATIIIVCIPFETGSPLKPGNIFLMAANSFKLEESPYQKGLEQYTGSPQKSLVCKTSKSLPSIPSYPKRTIFFLVRMQIRFSTEKVYTVKLQYMEQRWLGLLRKHAFEIH